MKKITFILFCLVSMASLIYGNDVLLTLGDGCALTHDTEIINPALRHIKGTLYFREGDRDKKLFEMDGSSIWDTDVIDVFGNKVILVKWVTPSQGKYLTPQIWFWKKGLKRPLQVLIPGVKTLYRGKASLKQKEGFLSLKLSDGLCSLSYDTPCVYRHRYWKISQDKISFQKEQYSRPLNVMQHFNFAHFLQEKKQFRKAVVYYQKGMLLLNKEPFPIPEWLRADVRLNYARALYYSGKKERAHKVFHSIVADFPKLKHSKEAQAFLNR